MINRILKRSLLSVMSDFPAHIHEVPCQTVTFSGSPETTQYRLLQMGYSPSLEFSTDLSLLIGGEMVCYCSHLFFSYYDP
jgi:hypothetical protein